MRNIVMKLMLAAPMLVGSSAVMAAEATEHEAEQVINPVAFEIIPFISSLIVFGVAFEILRRKAWPVILKALQEREEKIRKEISEAEQAHKQAQAALHEYEKALAGARADAAKLLETTRAEQQKLAAELRAKTQAELDAMKDSATRDIEAAKRAAITEIYKQMATTSTSIASKILQREINADDQRDLVEASLGELETVGVG